MGFETVMIVAGGLAVVVFLVGLSAARRANGKAKTDAAIK